MPENVDHRTFDWIHWIGAKAGVTAARRLEAVEGLYMGGTTGISYVVAKWLARLHEDASVVAIGPDEGHRYVASVFSPGHADEERPEFDLPDQPTFVNDPSSTATHWTAYRWRRRSLQEVMETTNQC